MSSDGKAVKKVQEKVDENLEAAKNKTENIKERVSDNISNIADKLHHGTDSGKAFLDNKVEKSNVLAHQALDKASQISHQAADAITNSSEYIKNLDLENARESVKNAFKERPEVLILTVGILGVAIGYLLGKKNI